MDFDFSDDQRMLKDSIGRMLVDRYDFEARTAHRQGPKGFSDEIWTQFAELGLLALPFAEEDGGLDGGATETMIVMEAFGAHLIVEPYLATVVLAGGILRHAGNQSQRQDLIPHIAEGNLVLAMAHSEPQSRYNLANVETTAKKDGDGYLLNGRKALVLNGDGAQKFIVSGRTSGDHRSKDGISLFLVDADTAGVSIQAYSTQDGMRAAEISLENVRVSTQSLLGSEGDGFEFIDQVNDEAIAALCAEAVGAFAKMHALTLDYIKTRHQFGSPISSFQALQHASVDMFIELEQSRSMAMYATMMSRHEDPIERAKAVSAAKVQIGKSATKLGQNAIQLHGGVGMTMEYAISHYFKRVTMIDKLFGDVEFHLGRLGDLGGLLDPDDLQPQKGAVA